MKVNNAVNKMEPKVIVKIVFVAENMIIAENEWLQITNTWNNYYW